MNRHFMRYVVIAVLCLLAASAVYAQPTDNDPKPNDKQAQTDYADAQTAESGGDYDTAIKLYGQVIKREPDFWPAYYKRGESYAAQENYKAAIEDYNQVIKIVPDYAMAYGVRGVAYENLNDHANALADSNKAIQLKVTDDYIYFNRGAAYFGLKDYYKAIVDFSYWIDLNPKTYPMAYYYRSLAYYAVSNFQGTLSDLDIFIEMQPQSAIMLGNRAFLQRLLGNYDDAISDYTKAIALKPDDLDHLYYVRGQLYGLQGQYDKMLEDLRAYAKLAGSQADTTVLDLLQNHPE